MSKDKIQLLSPLFLKYQTDFEKNPRSRVFAPLAETYRKLGMTDKAMEILSQGIRFHPTYVMGYLGLAFCYHDLKQFTLAYSTLRPLVETSRDNIRLQKLFADICLELSYREEALDTYKYLLFINPRDKEVAEQVAMLERVIEEKYRPVHQPIYIPESELTSSSPTYHPQVFDVDKLENRPNASKTDFDDWMALDLSREQKNTNTSDPHDFWNLKKGDAPLHLDVLKADELELENKEEIELEPQLLSMIKQDEIRDHYDDLTINLNFDDEEDSPQVVTEAPLVTHTLVDLYCGQGHMEKALEVLEKILILNPTDQRTINKISEIKSLVGHYEAEEDDEESYAISALDTDEFEVEKNIFIPPPKIEKPAKPKLSVLNDVSEEDGRKHLMSIFDEQIRPDEIIEIVPAPKRNEKMKAVEEKMSQFLKKIQKRALDYQARV